MLFCRVGGLSPVMHKNKKKIQTEHFPPPTKKGIYAFMWPYIERFLFMWSERNIKEYERNGIRIFKYEGPLWCHFDEEAKAFRLKGSWTLTDSEYLERILLPKVIRAGRECVMTQKISVFVRDPYKVGSCGGITMCRDFLEVYIEGKHLGKLK